MTLIPLETNRISSFAQWYWFAWLLFVLASFLWYEVWSLLSRHSENTLSNWIWVHLQIHVGESITQWSAGDLLTFSGYVAVFVAWLPWHFWLGKFT